MGGHGGINILHQKSWHVYNADNRAHVKRDEANYERECRAKENKEHSKKLSSTIENMSRRQGIDSTREHTESLGGPVNVKARDDVGRSERLLKEDMYRKNQYVRGKNNEDNKQGARGSCRRRDSPIDEKGNINLFHDVEVDKDMQKRRHDQYLMDIGHGDDHKCGFEQAIVATKSAWYLREQDDRKRHLDNRFVPRAKRDGGRKRASGISTYISDDKRKRQNKFKEDVNKLNFGDLSMYSMPLRERSNSIGKYTKRKENPSERQRDRPHRTEGDEIGMWSKSSSKQRQRRKKSSGEELVSESSPARRLANNKDETMRIRGSFVKRGAMNGSSKEVKDDLSNRYNPGEDNTRVYVPPHKLQMQHQPCSTIDSRKVKKHQVVGSHRADNTSSGNRVADRDEREWPRLLPVEKNAYISKRRKYLDSDD